MFIVAVFDPLFAMVFEYSPPLVPLLLREFPYVPASIKAFYCGRLNFLLSPVMVRPGLNAACLLSLVDR